ncbi:MAG: phage major tail tube protein [Pseudomonadota bacterium]
MLPKVLKNFNLFVDGQGYAGRLEEILLPKLIQRTEEFRLGGLDAPIQMDMGMEKLECEFTLSEYDVNVIQHFGITDPSSVPISLRGAGVDALFRGPGSPGGAIPLVMRGGLQAEAGGNSESRVVPVVIHGSGSIIELDFGRWSAGQHAPLKVRVALRYYRLVLDDKVLIEIDIDNRIRKIDGRNQISTSRSQVI